MIYFDNAATSKPLSEALRTYEEVNSSFFGNPSSNHAFGLEALKVLEDARQEILRALGLEKNYTLVFDSGATESNNLALKGLAFRYQNRGKKLITSAVEHPSVLRPLEDLRDHFGFQLVVLPVNDKGVVTPDTLAQAIDKDTILVSLMAVNNEVGSIFEVAKLSQIVHHYPKAFFHVDATQAMCKVALPYDACDLFSYSGHKFGGLKGTGALILKKTIQLAPVNEGGEQEAGLRAGTVDVAGMAAMAKAQVAGLKSLEQRENQVRPLFNLLYGYFSKRDDIVLNSDPSGSPYVLNFSLKKKKASVVVEALSNRGIFVSSVSACSSKEARFSYVVEAMGRSRDLASNSIRLSFSADNTLAEGRAFVAAFEDILQEVVDR